MPIYKQTTEITKIDDVWANIDRDIVEVYFGDKNIFTVWGEYDSTLPITINANGDVLIDYRIYGADGGVGARTENLFDPYECLYGEWTSAFGAVSGEFYAAYLDFSFASDCAVAVFGDVAPFSYSLVWYGENGVFISRSHNSRGSTSAIFNKPLNAEKMRFQIAKNLSERITLDDILSYKIALIPSVSVPESYVSYGYKLPMTVGYGNTVQNVPVYIGENQLDKNEYVSYGEQKIYRDVSGTLTPTDPPVPLPEIPTIAGETVIDYDGTPKPSQMYVKYRKQHS